MFDGNMTSYELAAQIIGFLGTITIIIGMQQKKYDRIVLCKITELRETTPDPASETSKPLFEPGTELSKCQELIRGYIILELRGGTLTKIK